ncbi:unnamed protein product [Triticum turgidum subsp. durum]|uniref:Endoglucanase n=1 Tax=Triticum turgidum subsp. durum TaxID=4567 RepID=A0A9R0YIM5_TRITD|nr:unnamed protein product [Triticum turgidum subsp. durum]
MSDVTGRFVLAAAVVAVSLVMASASAARHDYGDALSKSLLYFESQRSGRLPYNQRVRWRGHSGLTDGLEQGVDLVGGYYDAGDHVKFGLPMAFTVTMLSWAVLEYGDQIAAAGEGAHALQSIKWGTDYFIKAYKVDAEHPGSEVAAETAAAMAAASIVFRRAGDAHYAHLLLHHAQQLFEFADKYRGRYDASVRVVKSYYPSASGYNDELLWAALWLHRATGGREYLDYAVANADDFGGTGWGVSEFSWDIKYPGLQVLASKLLLEEKDLSSEYRAVLEKFRAKAEFYVCSNMNKNPGGAARNAPRTPAGLIFIRPWNNLQYVTNAVFLLTVHSDLLAALGEPLRCTVDEDADTSDTGGETAADVVVRAEEVLAFAKAQADYILGTNPMETSYLVGYSDKYPRRVHHRAASTASFADEKGFIGCAQGFDSWYSAGEENPHDLVGAVVGGPDGEDRFNDQRGAYMQTEACTYNTAPMVGVFSRLMELDAEERLREQRDL